MHAYGYSSHIFQWCSHSCGASVVCMQIYRIYTPDIIYYMHGLLFHVIHYMLQIRKSHKVHMYTRPSNMERDRV